MAFIIGFFTVGFTYMIGNNHGRKEDPRLNLHDGKYFKLLKVIPEQKLFIFEAANNGRKINHPFVIQNDRHFYDYLRFDRIEEGAIYRRYSDTFLYIDMRIFVPDEKSKTVQTTS